jgi:hypothetical protein
LRDQDRKGTLNVRERHAAAASTTSATTAEHPPADHAGHGAARPKTPARPALSPTRGASPPSTPSPPGATIERLILHQLDSARGRLELVDEEVALDERTHTFFAAQIAAGADRADWRAAFLDPGGDVPALCRRLLAGPDEFVAASRHLALRLYDQMRARPNLIAPGDFVVTTFRRRDGTPHVALLKLDLDGDRLVREFARVGSRRVVRIAAAENLLPEARHLQKCALLRPTPDAAAFEVTLLDTQAGPRSDGVAAFFYKGFLTAALVPSARRRTRLFLAASETWLAAHASRFTPAQLLGFYRARRRVLAGDIVHLANFAREALPEADPAALPDAPELRRELVAHLVAALFDAREETIERFDVDRATADPVVRAVTLELDGGARLKVDARLFDQLMRVTERRTGEQKIRLVLESLTLREVTGG